MMSKIMVNAEVATHVVKAMTEAAAEARAATIAEVDAFFTEKIQEQKDYIAHWKKRCFECDLGQADAILEDRIDMHDELRSRLAALSPVPSSGDRHE